MLVGRSCGFIKDLMPERFAARVRLDSTVFHCCTLNTAIVRLKDSVCSR